MEFHLVLDVDGTLVAETDNDTCVPARRPHLGAFLEFVFAEFASVSVWSNARPEWILPILAKIREEHKHPEFAFVRTRTRRRARSQNNEDLKKLKKVFRDGRTRDNTLILDDLPATYHQNYGNAVGISTWLGDPDDRELLDVMENLRRWLPEMAERGTVRHTHKGARLYHRVYEGGMYGSR